MSLAAHPLIRDWLTVGDGRIVLKSGKVESASGYPPHSPALWPRSFSWRPATSAVAASLRHHLLAITSERLDSQPEARRPPRATQPDNPCGLLRAPLPDARRAGAFGGDGSRGGRLVVHTHSQGIYPLRGSIADSLGLPVDRIELIHVPGSGCYGHNGADDAAFEAALVARALPGTPGLGERTKHHLALEQTGIGLRVGVVDERQSPTCGDELLDSLYNTRHAQETGCG